jgi:hypothetical protein
MNIAGTGLFSSTADPSLCMSSNGPIYQPSGSPQVVLATCSAADPSQIWTLGFISGPTPVYNHLNGNVFDVFNNEVTPGTVVETYSPNGGANQQVAWSGSSGQLTTGLNGFCFAVC